MPIIVSDERAADQLLISSNATIFEFDPWEMGSYDPEVFAYAPLQYVGSNFRNGVVPTEQPCTTGFDNIGFVVGTSSSLFNQFYLQINTTSISGGLRDALNGILGKFGASNDDISLWPNPFFGYNNDSNSNSQSQQLTLVDGGEDLQNIPFHPLLRSIRNVDIIFAVDGSADTPTNWPNGTALVATFERARQYASENSNGFPAVPDYNSFVNLGLNRRPTFFGCDVNQNKPVPLVVYLPNTPYTSNSNHSTFDFTTSDSDRNAFIQNAYNMATRANSTIDKQWPTCVGCAIMKRSWNRTATTVPDVCNQCFVNYCWNGTTNSTTPNEYNPTLLVAGSKSGALSQHVPWGVLGTAISVISFLQLMM
jgi:lysophospholipase